MTSFERLESAARRFAVIVDSREYPTSRPAREPCAAQITLRTEQSARPGTLRASRNK